MSCCCETCKEVEYLQRSAEENGDGQIFDVLGYPAVTLQVFGDLSGGSDVEVQFLSGTDWLPIAVENVSTGVVTDTGIITAEGTYRVNTTGLQKIKAEITGYTADDVINVIATAVCEAMATAAAGGGGAGGDVVITEPIGQDTMANSVSVVIASNQSAVPVTGNVAHDAADSGNPIKVGGKAESTIPTAVADGDRVDAWLDTYGRLQVTAGGVSAVVNGSFTRPNNTDTYATGEVVTSSPAAAITFANVARFAAGSGIITGALLIDSANQALKGSFELWLFDTAVTPDNDNAVFTPTDAELATLIGIIEFVTSFVGDATSGAGGNVVYPVVGRNVPFKCTGVLQDIYGVLVVRNAFVPVANEVFTVRLRILQD